MKQVVFGFLVVVSALAANAASSIDRALANLTNESQAIVVHSPNGVKAKLALYERADRGWKMLTEFDVVVGRKGFAPVGEKYEGDGRTPSGIYHLPFAYGYAAKISTAMPYRQAYLPDKWIDDPDHPDYNKWVVGPTTAKSYELMRRPDALYEYGIVVDYNMNPIVPGKGSAIFVHVWKNSATGTAGCVAMPRKQIISILEWLDPHANPAIILNP